MGKVVALLLMGVILISGMSNHDQQNNKPHNKPGPMQPFPTEICTAKTKAELAEKCEGKRVKFIGKMAQTIIAQPHLNYPDLSSAGGYINQSHIDTDLGQIVLISQKPIKCSTDIEVEGILRFAILKDSLDKKSYQDPYLQVLKVNCK